MSDAGTIELSINDFLDEASSVVVVTSDLEHPLAWKLIKAFDKSEVGRGMDAVEAAIELSRERRKMIEVVVKEIVGCDQAELELFMAEFVKFVQREGVMDDGKLESLFHRRECILNAKRAHELMTALCNNFVFHGRKYEGRFSCFGSLLQVWIGTAKCSTIEQVDHCQRTFHLDVRGRELLPWDELREVIAALPTSLE